MSLYAWFLMAYSKTERFRILSLSPLFSSCHLCSLLWALFRRIDNYVQLFTVFTDNARSWKLFHWRHLNLNLKPAVLNFFMTDSLLSVLWIPNQYINWVLILGLLSFLQFLFFTCEYPFLPDFTKLETVKLDLLVVVLLLCSTWKYQFSTGYKSHLSSLRN